MKNILPAIIGTALVIYSLNGLIAGEIYIPATDEDFEGYYSSGDGLVWTFLGNMCYAAGFFAFLLPEKGATAERVKGGAEKTPKRIAIPSQFAVFFMAIGIGLILGITGVILNNGS